MLPKSFDGGGGQSVWTALNPAKDGIKKVKNLPADLEPRRVSEGQTVGEALQNHRAARKK
jgi:hypothetical protein